MLLSEVTRGLERARKLHAQVMKSFATRKTVTTLLVDLACSAIVLQVPLRPCTVRAPNASLGLAAQPLQQWNLAALQTSRTVSRL